MSKRTQVYWLGALFLVAGRICIKPGHRLEKPTITKQLIPWDRNGPGL